MKEHSTQLRINMLLYSNILLFILFGFSSQECSVLKSQSDDLVSELRSSDSQLIFAHVVSSKFSNNFVRYTNFNVFQSYLGMAIAPLVDSTQMTQIRMNNSGLKVLKSLKNNFINNQINIKLKFLLIIGYGQLTNVS